MDVFTDIHSGLQFCINTEDSSASTIITTGIHNYDLIKWCEDFLTPEGSFVDIGSDMGTYAVILSKKCKEVYSFESDKSTFDRLNIGICLNNCFNIKANNISLGSGTDESTTLDSYEIKNVDFMRIVVKNELYVLKGAIMTLIINNFPPFILEVHNDEWYRSASDVDALSFVKELGYKIRSISGLDNTYLICDHNCRQSRYVDTSDVSSKSSYDTGFDITALSKRYESLDIKDNDPEVTWDMWHSLAMYYRKMSNSQEQAYDCAIKGLHCSPPMDKEYLLHEELAIVSFYLNKTVEGYQSCENVVLSPYATWNIRNYTLNNQAFYMKRAPFKKIISVKYHLLKDLVSSDKDSFNTPLQLPQGQIESTSSLVKNEDNLTYRLNLMTVNYSIDDMGTYEIRDRKQIVKNQSFLLTLDQNLSPIKGIPLEDVSGLKLYQQNIRGLENIRLFGSTEMFCTYRAVNTTHNHQICYCCYDPSTGNVTKVIPLHVDIKVKDEANWLPFTHNDEVHFVYKISPLTIYKLNKETGEASLIKEVYFPNKNLESFQGSGGLISYKEGWLGTCHQVYYENNKASKNFHRLIWFDREFTTIKYTKAFYFESPNIEFNLSICHSDEGLLIPYSQRYNNSKVGILNYEIIDSWLGF